MMKTNAFSNEETGPIQAELNRAFFELIRQVARQIQTWRQRSKQRFELGFLSTRELLDMGITSSQRNAEVNKPFWRA